MLTYGRITAEAQRDAEFRALSLVDSNGGGLWKTLNRER